MSRTKITQSLLAAWLYLYDCPDDAAEDAYEEFLRHIRREETEPSDAARAGISFENGVYALVRDPRSQDVRQEWRDVSVRIADILRGGQLQVKGSCDLSVGGDDFRLEGIADGIKAGVIYDVKFKTKRFHSLDLAGNYRESPQHPAYFRLFPGAYRFTYLVSDGVDLYTEEYERRDTQPVEDVIRDFIAFLRARGLYPLYKEKWEVT